MCQGSSGDGKDIGHFVEIMACPGGSPFECRQRCTEAKFEANILEGCLNGGGQIAPEKKPVEEDAFRAPDPCRL